MAQIIEVPGYGEVEFPDGMTDEAIVAAVQTMLDEAPKAAPEYDPTSGMSGFEKFAAGMGGQVRAAGRGIRDAMTVGLMTGNPYQGRIDQLLREKEDERRRLDAPLMATPEGQAGAITGGVAASVPAAALPGANTVLGGGLIGGLWGLTQPVGTQDSRLGNAAWGAGSGAAVPFAMNLVKRVAQPVRSVLTSPERDAVALLQQKGVPLTVAQQTGSRAAQGVERFLADSPVTGARMSEEAAKRGRAFTRAALKTAGIDADAATPEVLGVAKDRIGQVFDDVASRYSLDINQSLADLTRIVDEAGRVLPDDGRRIAVQVDRIVNKAAANGGKLDGATAQAIRRELDILAQQPDVSPYAVELRQVLEDALQKATQGTDDFARIQEARRQYRNLMAIADAGEASGTISGPRLAQRLKSGKHTRNSWRYGKGDTELTNLARSMSAVTDRFPNSGTAARAGYQLLPGAAAGAASLAMGGDPSEAAKWAALGYAGPQLLARIVNNPATANYLSRGLPISTTGNALLDIASRSGQLVPPYLLATQAGN